mmetsp:Transcript_65508/g.152100  ORF Transcript_65508/g.152100 Transcript_65508/m.152100 type:complete len:251 (+) Transcript_65508:918-1670(+)
MLFWHSSHSALQHLVQSSCETLAFIVCPWQHRTTPVALRPADGGTSKGTMASRRRPCLDPVGCGPSADPQGSSSGACCDRAGPEGGSASKGCGGRGTIASRKRPRSRPNGFLSGKIHGSCSASGASTGPGPPPGPCPNGSAWHNRGVSWSICRGNVVWVGISILVLQLRPIPASSKDCAGRSIMASRSCTRSSTAGRFPSSKGRRKGSGTCGTSSCGRPGTARRPVCLGSRPKMPVQPTMLAGQPTPAPA